MNLEQWAYVAEMIAAVGVIASLVYLAKQVHQSNILSRAQTRQSMIELARDEIIKQVDDPAIWFAFTKADISQEDKAKLHMYLIASMRRCEFEWLAKNDEIIDGDMYESYAGVIPIILGTERTRRWWKVHGHEHSFAPGFVRDVDKRLAESPLTGFWESLDEW